MKVGVIGSATVGQTLAAGFAKHGYDVRIASRNPAKLAPFTEKSGVQALSMAEAASWADLAVLSISGNVAEAVVRETAGALRGKTVIDTMNPIAKDSAPVDGVLRYFTPANSSLMEQLQAAAPDVKFVKAFNSVGAGLMVNPAFPGGAKPTMFFCGNDAAAKATVAAIIERFGWEPMDMGSARAAGPIEALCQLWCIPSFLRRERTHAFHMLRS